MKNIKYKIDSNHYSSMLARLSILFLIQMILFCFISDLHGQRDNLTLWKLITKGGNEYIGEIVEQNDTMVLLNSKELGEFRIKREAISYLRQVRVSRIEGGFRS